MLHINTRQIDNHCWHLEVTDGYHIQWTATFSSNLLRIWQGEKDYGKEDGWAYLQASHESGAIGDAMTLVFNWAQYNNQSNEMLNKRWTVENKNLNYHYAGSLKHSTVVDENVTEAVL